MWPEGLIFFDFFFFKDKLVSFPQSIVSKRQQMNMLKRKKIWSIAQGSTREVCEHPHQKVSPSTPIHTPQLHSYPLIC